MQYLVLLSRSDNASSFVLRKEELEAEAEFVRRLYADGTLRQVWLRAEGGACMLAESADGDSLAQVLTELPLVKLGYLSKPQLSQLRSYSGFGPRVEHASD